MAQPGPAAIPAAVAAGVAAAPLAIDPAEIVTYAEKFTNCDDLYQGTYAAFLHAHRPDATVTPAEVLQTALSLKESGIPDVYAYQEHDTFRIRTVHRLSQAATIPGVVSPWDGLTFAFEGDVTRPGIINVIQLPPNLFYLTTAVEAPSANALNALWPAAAAVPAACVGPCQAGDADVTAVSTRRMMPVPHAYVRLLHNRSLTPQQAWQEVAEQIILDGRAADCSHFLDFLRVACTFRPIPNNGAAPAPPATAQPQALTLPLTDDRLKRQIWAWLVRDLPALDAKPNDTFQGQMVANSALIRHELQLQRADKAADRQAAKAPKTATEAFPGYAAKLRNLCGVDVDDELPEFWKQWASTAGKSKSQGMALLQQLLNNRAQQPDSAGEAMVLSVPLYEIIIRFDFGAEGADAVDQGLSPFLVVPKHFHQAEGVRTMCNQYTMLHAGGNTATLNEVKELAAHKWNAPHDSLDLVSFTGSYSVLIDTVFGADQECSRAMRAHAAFIRTNATMLRTAVPPSDLPGVLLNILRSQQLTTVEYFNVAQELGRKAAPPDYSFIENAIKRRTWFQLSAMPPRYLAPVMPTNVVPVRLPVPPVSAAVSAPTPLPSPTRTVGTAIDAPVTQQVSEWHTKFAASAHTVAALKAMADRPALCLSYHLRGKCFDNCRDKGTHCSLGPTERQTMQVFVDKHL